MTDDDQTPNVKRHTPQDEVCAWIWVLVYAATACVFVIMEMACAAWIMLIMWKIS